MIASPFATVTIGVSKVLSVIDAESPGRATRLESIEEAMFCEHTSTKECLQVCGDTVGFVFDELIDESYIGLPDSRRKDRGSLRQRRVGPPRFRPDRILNDLLDEYLSRSFQGLGLLGRCSQDRCG